MKKYISLLLGILFAALAWVRLVMYHDELLYEAQEQNFWQSGAMFFQQVLQQPGGVLSWCGMYLTQYFYYPALGATMLVALWLVIYVCTLLGLRLPWYLSWVALIVPAMLLFAETSMTYAIYSNKVPDWWFTPTLFFTLVSLLVLLGRWRSLRLRLAWVGCLAVASFFISYSWMVDARVPEPLRVPFYSCPDDDNFRTEIRMERAAERADWTTVLTELRQVKQKPTRAMWLYKNIALLQQGRLATDWLNYPVYTQLPQYADSIVLPMVEMQGPMIYLLHGSIEFAYRWSMENMVEYGPSVKRLRLMVHCALIKGEWALADKYLTLLERTTFYSDWARQQRELIGHPELIAQHPLYALPLRLSKARPNILDGDEAKVETYLMRAYPQNGTYLSAELAELCVMYALQSQNIQYFWPSFFEYAHLHDGQPMPELLQQAVYLFLQLEPQSAPKTDFPFDKKVIDTYAQFNARAEALMRQGVPEESLGEAMQREFGRTYYWFYFFVRNLSTY